MNPAALRLLQNIQDVTTLNAPPMPSKESAEPAWQGIGFQLGGVRLVSPMGEVSELLHLNSQSARLAALPGVKPWVMGISNIRGELIPIIDLHAFLGLSPTLPSSHARVLIVQEGDVAAGFVVEQSLGIQHFVLSSFEPPGSDVPPLLAPYVKGVYRHGGRVFYELQLKAILQDPRFFDVAQTSPQDDESSDMQMDLHEVRP
jgi:twitching motility protein PilI